MMNNQTVDQLLDSLSQFSPDDPIPLWALRMICSSAGALPALQPQIDRGFTKLVKAVHVERDARAKVAAAARSFGTALDDAALLGAVIDGGEDGWREFVRRYDASLRVQVSRIFAINDAEAELPSDAIDDVMGDFYLSLCADDKRKLRAFAEGDRGMALETWLAHVAGDFGARHIATALTARAAVERSKLEPQSNSVEPIEPGDEESDD